MEEFNVNEIVVIEQLPEIYQQLDKVNKIVVDKTKDIDKTLEELSKLSINEQEEKKQDIKKYRTYLNSIKTSLETKRKEIKKAILEPYEEFENVYKDKTLKVLDDGIGKLTSSINTIEAGQIQKKYDILIPFFDEYVTFYHLENIISFDDLPIKVNLSNSVESLKKEIVAFCEKVNNDMIAISSEEFRDEILLEYQNNGYDYTKAKITITERHKKLEEVQKLQEQVQVEVQQETAIIENVNTLCSAPIEIEEEEEQEDDEIIEVSFTIKATEDKILKLKDYLKEMRIDYE